MFEMMENSELNETAEQLGKQEQWESVEQLEQGVVREWITRAKELVDPEAMNEKVIGEPEMADDHWHKQAEPYSCAIACQEFVAEQLLDRDFSEQEMIDYAEKKGWYDPESGTSPMDTGNLLEAIGLDVERSFDTQIKDIAQALENGEKVICGVNNMVLQVPELAKLPGFSANHAVEVIGIDYSDASNPVVILNDPGVENGKGIRHDLNTFVTAWKTSDCFAAIVGKEEKV